MAIRLKYIGKGDAFIEVPARDLTDADFAERQARWNELGITESVLLDSGLYERADGETAPEAILHEPKKKSKRGATPSAQKEGE